jgi:hypothetical protein
VRHVGIQRLAAVRAKIETTAKGAYEIMRFEPPTHSPFQVCQGGEDMRLSRREAKTQEGKELQIVGCACQYEILPS